MAIHIVGGSKVKGIHVQNAPNTYDANITPENMQKGLIGYARGKRVVGTGKAFEFAKYGTKTIDKITDGDGIIRDGTIFKVPPGTNLIFVAPTTFGDITLQSKLIVDMQENSIDKVGINTSNGSDLKVSYSNGILAIYFTSSPTTDTNLNIFIGKDNEL